MSDADQPATDPHAHHDHDVEDAGALQFLQDVPQRRRLGRRQALTGMTTI